MTGSRARSGGLIVAAAVAATVALAVLSTPDPPALDAEFHRLVGGLGLGPGLDMSRCPAAFDARVCAHCEWDTGPVPGGRDFCPHHGLSTFGHPEPIDAPAR